MQGQVNKSSLKNLIYHRISAAASTPGLDSSIAVYTENQYSDIILYLGTVEVKL